MLDTAIQQCSEIYSLLDAIEDARQESEDATDENTKQSTFRRGIDDLRRYFVLVLFATWLNESSGESLQTLRDVQSFERYVRERPGKYVVRLIQKTLKFLASVSNYLERD